MAKSKTTITKDTRDNMPPRGRSKRTLIIEAMREQALLGVKKDASNEDVEKAWFAHLVENAVSPDSKDSGLCIRLLTERGWAALKPSSECVRFEFDHDAAPHVQASQVMRAVAEEIIPPDLGIAFVGGIRSMLDIEANTELKAEIERIKEKLGIE